MNENALKNGCIMQLLVFIGLLVALAVIGGSWRTEVIYRPPTKASSSDLTPFEEVWTANHFLGGVIRGEHKDLGPVLAKYIRPGEELTELSVTTKLTIGNVLLSMVTLGIYTPNTVEVRGFVDRAAGSRSKNP